MNCKWCNDKKIITDKECSRCLIAKGGLSELEFNKYIINLAKTTIFKGFLETYENNKNKAKVLK